MAYLIVMVVLLLICGGAILYGLATNPLWIAGGAAAAVVFIGGGTLVASYHQIGSHEVGVVSGISGVVSGSIGPGTHTTAPWDSVAIVDTGVQKADFDRVTAFSKESQDVFVTVQLNYHFDPSKIVELYRTVGGDFFDKFVPGAVNQDVKEETVRYYTTDLAPHRAQIAQDVEQKLKSDLEPHSIYVDSVYLVDVDYSAQFKSAIEQKQVASQEAQRASLKAQEQRNAAAGDRDSTIIRAQGQARANEILARSLSDRIIRYELVQKLSPNIKVLLPSQGNILNLDGLTK